MTEDTFWVYVSFHVILYILVAVAIWLCYRRTRIKGFLWLGVALVVWPVAEFGLVALYYHFRTQVMNGQRPWLFPYSIMVRGESGWSGQEMPMAFFKTYLDAVNHVIGLALLAFALWLLARSFKKPKAEVAGPSDENAREGLAP